MQIMTAMERPAPALSMLSRADIAYTAGLIDGEGCVGISPWDGTWHVAVSVSSTNFDVLHWLMEHWGGHITGPYVIRPENRPQGQWTSLRGRKIRPLLKAIRPHVKIKGPQIDNALRMIDLIIRYGKPGSATPEYRAAQVELYWIQRQLNHKGSKPFVRDRDLTPPSRERMF